MQYGVEGSTARMNPRLQAYWFAIFAIGIGLLVWQTYVSSHENFDTTRTAVRAQEDYWKSRIADIGPTPAYEEFALSVATATPESQHDGAHLFGGALFEARGVEGLSTCDARFSYGCFHEFLGRAIAELGLSSVPLLNEKCQSALIASPLSCQHGIGHGVLAALGYDENSIRQALTMCRDLPHNDPIGGCYGGAFMEYNMRTMLGKEGKLRIVLSNMQEPCDRLPETFKLACTYWQVQWWHQVMKEKGETEEAIFPAMGKLCDAVPLSLQKTCYEGMGNITPPAADFDAARSKELCELSSVNLKSQLFCKSFAANSLSLGGAGKVGDGKAICEGLSDAHRTFCESYAKNEANLLNVLDVPRE